MTVYLKIYSVIYFVDYFAIYLRIKKPERDDIKHIAFLEHGLPQKENKIFSEE